MVFVPLEITKIAAHTHTSRSRPERIPLVAVDLVECLPDGHPTPLQLHMNQRKAVDQNRHIVAVIMPRTVCLLHFILVDDLQAVIVDVLLSISVIIFWNCHHPDAAPARYLLNLPGPFGNMFVGVGNYITWKNCRHSVSENW